ncbi:TRAP transporter large permease subunit [Halomonas sp. DP5N14-9]|uniref:TRAP transporter large permease subunit n=1 Tax=Halomonas sp. DP5N14-9 TaxID=2859075 RepID=UPI0028F7357F|nr:TRAP transporter large permease subunit [Halomonas sp. DP5N14-9]
MIMIMCSMVGLLTPPVGMVLFATSSIAKISVGRLSRALTPYLIVLFVVLMAVVMIPAISTWLPDLVMNS